MSKAGCWLLTLARWSQLGITPEVLWNSSPIIDEGHVRRPRGAREVFTFHRRYGSCAVANRTACGRSGGGCPADVRQRCASAAEFAAPRLGADSRSWVALCSDLRAPHLRGHLARRLQQGGSNVAGRGPFGRGNGASVWYREPHPGLVIRAPPRHSSNEPPCVQLALKCPNQRGPRSLAFLLGTGIRAACPCVPSLRGLPVHGHKQRSRSRPRSATARTQPRGTWLTNGVCSRFRPATHPRTGEAVMSAHLRLKRHADWLVR